VFLLLSLLSLLAGLAAFAEETPAALPDPLPLRRVLLSGERLQQELKKVRDGVLVQMPLAEFEARVQRAARAASRTTPRLAEARYRASLRDGAAPSLGGSGQWTIVCTGTAPEALGLLPLQPFNLALRQARFENRDALVAEFDGRTPALLVEGPGEHAVALEWSARGEARPDGLRFDLKFPASPVAVLEIDVPAGRAVAALNGAMLSGPHPAEAADRALWKVYCGGRTQVNLLVRPAAPAADPKTLPLTFVRQTTVQNLSPEGLEAHFNLSLEVLHPGARELVFECDPELRVRDVTAPSLEGWETVVGAKGGPTLLTVRLREPLREGDIGVSCLAPLDVSPPAPADKPSGGHGPRRVGWRSPGLRLAGGVPRGEKLELSLDPELRVEGWDPGGFRPAALGEPDRTGRKERLVLVGGGLAVGAASRAAPGGGPGSPDLPAARPHAMLRVAGADFRARQLALWQVGPGLSLTLQIGYEVHHGRLFQLPVLLPPGWEVERVEMNLPGLLRSWSVRPAPGRPLLLVDLLRPLAGDEETRPNEAAGPVSAPANPPPRPAGTSAARPRTPTTTLTVQLRPIHPGPFIGRDLPFPDAVPLGARLREGVLAVDFDEQTYRAVVTTPAETSEADEEGPWGRQTPAYFYRYSGSAVAGRLRLEPRPPEVRARCTSEVFVASGRATIETHLLLDAAAGSTDVVDLMLSAGAAGSWPRGPATAGSTGPWVWHEEGDRAAEGGASALARREGPAAPPADGGPVRRADRLGSQEAAGVLSVLACRDPVQAAAMLAAGQRLRLRLARPLRAREPLRLVATALLKPGRDGRWEVPLVIVPTAVRMEGEVTLHLAGADVVQVEAAGLREARRRGEAAGAWRTFRYGQAPAALMLRGQAPAAPASAETIDRAALTTYLLGDGVLQHHFRFEAAHWAQDKLLLLLPKETKLRAAQVDGHWLTRLEARAWFQLTDRSLGSLRAAGVHEGVLAKLDLLKDKGFASREDLAARLAEILDKDELGKFKEEVLNHAEAQALPLPVPARGDEAGDAAHRFEVVYTTQAGSGLLWARLEAPAPQLPVRPTTFRRTWRLPPGVTPLSDGRQQRLPGAGGADSIAQRWAPADLFRLGGLPRPWPAPAGETDLLAALDDAARSLRVGRDSTLREVVDKVAFIYLKDRFQLVIDSAALREAALTADSPVRVPPPAGIEDSKAPWEEGGVAIVPAGTAALLTTRRQWNAWREPDGPFGLSSREAPLPAAIRQAVAEAAERGQDPSGRFRSALTWLRPEAAGRVAGGLPGLPASLELAAWGAWEPVAGDDDGTLAVVYAERSSAAAGVLTAILVFLGWRLRRRPWRLRLTLLLLVGALAGVGLLWLPASLQALAWWPLVAALAVALVWYLFAVRRLPHPSPRTPLVSRRVAGAAVAILTCTLLGTSPVADAPGAPPPGSAEAEAAPPMVFLVPAGEAGKMNVLVPAAVLDRLRTLAERPALPGGKEAPDAVLLSASYEGKVEDRAAEFAAVFAAHSLADEATLALPLDGVQLIGDVWLDGARALPVALPPHKPAAPATGPDKPGYALAVKGRGSHKVEMRFRAPLAPTAAGQAVQLTLPPLVQSRLVFRLPPGATYPQALVAHGAQAEVADPMTPSGKRLEADLGRLAGPLVIRWSPPAGQAPGAAQTPKVQYRVAYLWDLRLKDSTLQALVRYRVPRGAVTALAVALPPELEVHAAEAHRTPAAPGKVEDPAAAALVRLKDWRVEGPAGKRLLHLEFPAPVAGDFDVLLELVPHAPLPATAALPLPVPVGELLSGENNLSYLAYRTQGMEARPEQLLRVTGIQPKDFAPFWPASSRPDPATLAYACTVGKDPLLRLRLGRAPAVVDADQKVAFRVGSRRAEMQAQATLAAPGKDLAFVEWQVQSAQSVTIAGVSGLDVRSWSQAGDRVRVWLGRAVADTRLHLSAWLPVQPAAPGKDAVLPLPCLKVVGAREQHTTLQLSAVGDLALEMRQPLKNLTRLADPPASEQGLAFTAASPDYAGECQVRPAAANLKVSVRTVAEVRDRKLVFAATVDYHLPKGELRVVRVRLRDWEGEAVRLEAASMDQRRERRRALGDRTWTLDLKEGVKDEYSLTLSGELPLEEAAAGVLLPDVTVPGVKDARRWLAVVGSDLGAETHGALRQLNAAALDSWPVVGKRVRGGDGSAWEVTGPEHKPGAPARDTSPERQRWDTSPERQRRDFSVRLQPRGRAAGPAQAFLAEHAAAVVDHRRWLHEVVWWLGHEAHTDLNVDLPAAARVVGVSVDGTEMAPLQPAPAQLWLPLPGRAGVRRVRLRWLYEGGESLERPNLEPPRLEGTAPAAAVWTVYVPAGWEPSGSAAGGASGLGRGPTRLAALDLYRAAALVQVSRTLAAQERDGAGALADAQRRFALCTQHAGQALAAGAARDDVSGPAGQGLGEWREALVEENRALAEQLGFGEVREQAEREARAGTLPGGADGPMLPERGTPLSWRAGPGGEAPRLRLTAADSRRSEAAKAATGWWLGLLGVVWFIAMVPFLAAGARRLWPEQMLLLGALGGYLAGPTFLVLFLLLLGACGRLLLLVGVVRRSFRRRPAPSTNVPAGGIGV
jgi:hypothetical protein